jgi:dipeptidyl aminopeptidase/acylaminoacyl peptidase
MQIFDANALIKMNRVSALAPSPCGTWVAVACEHLTDKGDQYTSSLFRLDARGEGDPIRLTRGDKKDSAPCFRRDGSLAFLSNRPLPGNEPGDDDKCHPQIWILPEAGGEPFHLTDEPLGIGSFSFAKDGNRLVATALVSQGIPLDEARASEKTRQKEGPSILHYREMPIRFWDHWLGPHPVHFLLFDADGKNRIDLIPEADLYDFMHADWDISEDGTRLVVTRQVPASDRLMENRLILFNLDNQTQEILWAPPRTGLDSPRLSPDGQQIAITVNERIQGECVHPRLAVFHCLTKKTEQIAPDWDLWPQPMGWTTSGSHIVVSCPDHGEHNLFRVHGKSGAIERITDAEAPGSFHPGTVAHGRVWTIQSRIHQPPTPVSISISSTEKLKVLGNLAGDDPLSLEKRFTWESLETTSTDGEPIQYFLVKPRGMQENPLPTIIWIHGGPMSQWTDGWHWRWNSLLFAERGYALVLPNPRGSTGFGQAFTAGIWGNQWGAQCFEDVMAVTDAVSQHPEVDAERIAAMGGSFGGYMTNWIGGNTDRFRCLVTHASLFSFDAFYGVTDFPPWWSHSFGASPYDDPVAHNRYSPHTRVGNWKSPTMIVHGEKDYRVPIGESMALFEALKLHGVDAELVVFPDENHWILKPKNIIAWHETILNYLDKHLKLNKDA